MKSKLAKMTAVAMISAMVLALSACGSSTGGGTSQGTSASGNESSSAAPAQAANGEVYELFCSAASTTGSMYSWVVPACEIVNKYGDGSVYAEAVTTNGAAGTMEYLRSGEIQMGGLPGSTAYFAVNGIGPYEGDAVENLQVVTSCYSDYYVILTGKDSDLNTIEDIAGKRFAIGSATNVTSDNTKAYFAALGIDIEEYCDVYNISFGDGVAALQEGTVDCVVSQVSTTNSTILELASSQTGMKAITFSDEQLATIQSEYPFLQIEELPSGTYPNVDQTFNALRGVTTYFARDDASEDAVYQFLKILNEHHDEWVEAFSSADYSVPENTVRDWNGVIDFHPGAIKYFEELGLM